MNKIVALLIITISFWSCKTMEIEKEDYSKFTTKSDTIYHDGIPVAVYLNIEWEYYMDKKTVEISVQRIGGGIDKMTDDIANFIRNRHPGSKVEVKIPPKW